MTRAAEMPDDLRQPSPTQPAGHEPGVLDGMKVPAKSVAGMLAMKE
jgi:hypothetical protein